MTNSFEFFAGLVSFAIVVIVLKKLLFGSIKGAAEELSASYRSSLTEARDILHQAKERSVFWNSKSEGLAKELADISQKARSDSEKLFSDTMEATEREAQSVITSAKLEADNLKDALKHALQSDLADRVAYKAEELIRNTVDDEEIQRNVIENMLTKMGSKNA